jgi:alpha-glucosidase
MGWAALVAINFAATGAVAAGWEHLGPLTAWKQDDRGVTLTCGPAVVRVEAVTSAVVRVRLAPGGTLGRDFSWAVDDLSTQGRFHVADVAGEPLRLTLPEMTVEVSRDPCRLTFRDAAGRVILAGDANRGLGWCDVGIGGDEPAAPLVRSQAVRGWFHLPDKTRIYGLGEKSGPLNKRGMALSMWNTDAFHYSMASDPLYKSIPFFMLNTDDVYHGVFFDNPWRTSFDFGKETANLMSFGADGGEMNFYVIAGPGPKDVIERYTALTGRTPMPPKWALGYHQCRFSYYPEAQVREIAQTFRDKKIPCDVLYFDIDYMDAFKCFTWDKKLFPDPKKLMADLRAMGFRTVAIIDPGIKNEPGYFAFDTGTAADVWVKKPDGEPYVGRVWPGDTVFPDYTKPAAREWWAGQFPPFIAECGLDGIWCDMNEPANFAGPNHTVPLDLVHDNDGAPAPHPAAHNVYGMLMAKATLEGMTRARPTERQFVMTRATYAGGQRYGAAWTGDNTSTWEHLRLSVTMVLGLGVSGMPFVGPDIGGFIDGPHPELYARWMTAASLMPYCRTHTGSMNPPQEPWSFGPEVEEIARRALTRRYELLPYIYTLFEEASRTGVPVVRPVWMEFPGFHPWWEGQAYMLGGDLLIVPIVEPSPKEVYIELPPGAWYDMATDEIWGGGEHVKLDTSLGSLPIFVRAGAVIPMQSPVQSTAETPAEPLVLHVWPFGSRDSRFYEDDGAPKGAPRSESRTTRVSTSREGDDVFISLEAPSAPSRGARPGVRLRIHGLGEVVEAVRLERIAPDAAAMPAAAPGSIVEMRAPAFEPVLPSGEAAKFGASMVYREADRTWALAALPDSDSGQSIALRLRAADDAKAPAVRIALDPVHHPLGYRRSFLPPTYDGRGGVAVELRHEGWPYFVLPRVRFDAASHPTMKLRMKVDHATKLAIQFATEQEPSRTQHPSMEFPLVADGKMHDYTFNLPKAAAAAEGDWEGTVYQLLFGFPEGAKRGEKVVIEAVEIGN